jgi:hypothetical protein
MGSSDDSTSFRNALSRLFLRRIAELDEPATAGEADVAGPWHVEEIPGPKGETAFGLFRAGESLDRGFEPAAVFRWRWLALLAAAGYPATGRDAAFRLAKEKTDEGFSLTTAAGESAGHLELFDENLVAALHVLDSLIRTPESLAWILEAAGAVALERAGAILDERV